MTAVLERPADRLPDLPKPPTRVRRLLDGLPTLPRPTVPIDAGILAGLVLAVLIVQGVNIAGYPAVGDDEGTYLAQAWAVQQGQGLAHYAYWYDHPPLGWLQIAALSWIPALLMPDHLVVANARVVMLPISLVATSLLYVFGRRLALPRWAAALGSLMFSLSPLAVTMQRQIYLDNIAVVWMLGAFVLALSPKRHLWHHVAAGCCAAISILSKETMLVVLPALLIALWQGSHPSTRKFSIVGFLSLLGLVGILYPLYALLNNELLPGSDHVSLVGGILFQIQRPGSGTFLESSSAARTIVESWLYYDAVLPLAGIIAAVVAIIVLPRLRAPAVAVLLLLVMGMRPGYLPAMYIIQALPFLALCIAGVLAAAVGVLMNVRPQLDGTWRLARIAVIAVVMAGLAAVVVPQWVAGDRTAMTRDANSELEAAVEAIAELPHDADTKVMVDDAIWLDLVRQGYRPGLGAIWFYKLELDPAVKREVGWRDVDYVISTPIVRDAMSGLTAVTQAVEGSTVIRTFGAGDERIEIRKMGIGS